MWSVKSQIVKEANPFLFGNENLPFPNVTKPRITARLLKMVGEEGFEPPTLWSQTRCATKLRYSPKFLLCT